MHNFCGGRSDLFNSGGRWSKGGRGRIFSKFRGALSKKGELKNSGGFGPWMKLCDRGFNFGGFNFGAGLRGLN